MRIIYFWSEQLNCKGQQGGLDHTPRTEEAVLKASLHRELPPAGHGIKGKGTKLPVPVIFSGQNLPLLSNWEPSQKLQT